MGFCRQSANGPALCRSGGVRALSTVTCAECSAWSETARAYACATILTQWQVVASGIFLCWLEMRWDGGSSVVSCSQTPPLQRGWPFTASLTTQASEDVQPANGHAGSSSNLETVIPDWVSRGGKNSIYAPMTIRPSHSSIRSE